MKLKALFASALLGFAACANASVMTFDNVPVTDGVSLPGFNTAGFQFSDSASVIDVSPGSPFGEGTNGGHSGMYATLNDFVPGGTLVMNRVGGGLMSVANLWIHGWLGSADDLLIEGYRDDVIVQTANYSFSDSWELLALNFNNIDTLTLSSFSLFLVDDLNATPRDATPPGTVPEPTTLLLFVAALAALAFARKRRA
ncbi:MULTISPECIES: PEP-CTERM sorting domain-containing protein [unclassified Duganella]|uniref:PEP-CTERM sorting domain-containing protein n=1 Tax=unclassified Duganella TaxID=2636909 RepID=UPI0006FAA9BD|nr:MULTISPECIES: PEP-CTERM sorting domain-containing protein [unclassified Duganella]KQV59510.1 hypothetical protein ASD07_25195 [Duganella sp. Root336D2]KRB93910.1 hypothetical protein ASE26_27490 [Duganella sp. Root198D2]